jgi:DNA-binding response OmpR family regulator
MFLERQDTVSMAGHQQQRSASAIVLVVENDVLKRVHSAAALRRRGFQVFEAVDTTEAITILNKIPVDALFSDVSLVGGAKLARWVRQRQLPLRTFWTADRERVRKL